MPEESVSSVVKGFETIPAYELIKYEVVRRLVSLTDLASKTQSLIYMARSDPVTVFQFLSEVLTFYQFLRPKIKDYAEKTNSENYRQFIKDMDYFVKYPKKFDPENAIMAFSNLNEFCEKYKLTNTTIYSGYARPNDTYRV